MVVRIGVAVVDVELIADLGDQPILALTFSVAFHFETLMTLINR